MSEETNNKLDKIIELLEKVVKNTDPMNPYGLSDVRSAVDDVKSSIEDVEGEAKKIRRHLIDKSS